MFDFLKKKISGFVDGLTKKKEEPEEGPPEEKREPPKKRPPEKKPAPKEKRPEPKKAEPKEEKPPKKEQLKKPEAPPKKEPPKKPEKKAPPKIIERVTERIKKAIPAKPEKRPEPPEEIREGPEKEPRIVEEPEAPPEVPEAKPEIVEEPAPVVEEEPEPAPEEEPEMPIEREGPVAAIEEEEPEALVEGPEIPEEAPPKEPEKPKERIRLGALSAIKGFVTREIEISESDVTGLLENFELELLESDVELSVAEAIREELHAKLVGSKVKKDRLHEHINETIKETLVGMITNDDVFDLVERVRATEKPAKIMFLGINGAGKTTTIGKVARLLMDSGNKVVFAAADTFRAAAIEQMEVHAKRLDVKIIKRDYGSDPTSVAFDAVNYAKARGIDAVLIDTAGRQDTNISLLNEIKKMNRVIQPDLKIYIGESIAGNAIIEQITSFNREVGIDAVILTKMDCDPKGGTMLSINKATGIPIIYVGVGQGYEDLEPFVPERIIGRIVE